MPMVFNNHKRVMLFVCLFLFILSSILSQNADTHSPRTSEQEAWVQRRLSAEELAWLNEHQQVRAKLSHNPPMFFFDNELRGISIDFLKIVSQKTGLQFDYFFIDKPWDQVLEDFKTHKEVDLLLSLKVTEDRKSFIAFTDEYIEIPLVIFTKDNAGFITSIEDLKGQRIVVEKGFWIETQLKKEFPDFELITKRTSSDALEALSTNEADAYIGNLVVGTYIIKTKGYRNLKVAASTPYKYHNQAMGVRKDWPELASILSKVFSEITIEERNEIWNPYFAIRFEHGIQAKDILKYSLFILVFFAFMVFWNRRLKKEIKNRLAIEGQLKESEIKFKTLAQSSSEGIVFSKDSIIMECNSQAGYLLGYEQEELIGQNIFQYLTEEWRAVVNEQVQGGIESFYEVDFLCKDRSILPVEVTARIIAYKGKQVRVTIFRDITIAKQAEKEREMHRVEIENHKRIIEEDNRQLKALNANKNKFFSIIAHDLKGPIGTLSKLTELLLLQDKTAKPEERSRIIDALYSSSKNTFALLENLLQWSTSEMDGLSVEKEHLNLCALVNENIELLRENCSQKNIEISHSLDDDLVVYSDLNITHTVIRNLISNAIKFTYDFGTIQVYVAHQTEDFIDLCIEDNGVGMEKKVLNKLFLLDSKHSTHGTRNESGTGLGLKLCKEFSARVGGELFVESIAGKGSKFTVRLPRNA